MICDAVLCDTSQRALEREVRGCREADAALCVRADAAEQRLDQAASAEKVSRTFAGTCGHGLVLKGLMPAMITRAFKKLFFVQFGVSFAPLLRWISQGRSVCGDSRRAKDANGFYHPW